MHDIIQNMRTGLQSGWQIHINTVYKMIITDQGPDWSRLDKLVIKKISPVTKQDVLRNIQEASNDPKAQKAAQTEIKMIGKFGTWELVPIENVPLGKPLYHLIWRFTRKMDRWMRARLCFPGHQQRYRSDYSNTSSPTVAMASFRLFMTICKYCGVIPTHMDIRNTYLHTEVDEEIYM